MLSVDTSSNKVQFMYLHLLANLPKVCQYASGATTLAILYRYLCRASQKGIRVIGGFYLYFRPQRDPNLLVDDWLISILPGPPRARVWSNGLSHDTKAPHLLYLFRDQLDLLIEHQLYSPDIFATIPDYCVNGFSVWHTIIPIIAGDAVEWHYPDKNRGAPLILKSGLITTWWYRVGSLEIDNSELVLWCDAP
ncbi:hypothetical protein FXO38_14459 [Capsicum annuum]|nr:hypothetical protein FXO38_14459 [Capsicum annuum]KAF3682329.1 hypothetical protein FXO37_02406 [Capsicum annuum]